MAVFFDTHAHLDYPVFAPDFAQIIERAPGGGDHPPCLHRHGSGKRCPGDQTRRTARLHLRRIGWHPSGTKRRTISDLRCGNLPDIPRSLPSGKRAWITIARRVPKEQERRQ